MNFLELCQRMRQESGISGTGPTSVVNQSGESKRIVDWVRQAWIDLQLWHEWDWMRGEFTLNTVAGTQAYSAADAGLTDCKYWHEDTFRIYKQSEGVSTQQYFTPSDYDWFRDVYMFGGTGSMQGRPNTFAVRSRDKALVLGYIPDDVYVVTGEYQKSPQQFAADADNPTGLESEFEMLIVYIAMTKYAGYAAAQEVMADAVSRFKPLMARMEQIWLPPLSMGGPLA